MLKMLTHNTLRLLVAIVLVLTGLLGGCDAKRPGASAEDMSIEDVPLEVWRDSANKFFVVQGAAMFYPTGVPQDPGILPTIGEKEMAAIEELLNRTLEVILDFHRLAADHIEANRGKEVVADPTVAIRLTQDDRPITAVSFGRTPTIKIDIRMAQTIYRSIIVGQVVPTKTEDETPEIWAERIRRTKNPLILEHERAATQAYLSMVEWVTTGSSTADVMLGDIQLSGPFGNEAIDLGEDRNDPYLQAAIGWGAMRQLEQRYLDILGFLIAHELAHVVYRHDKEMESNPQDCQLFETLEAEADEYATSLLGFYSGDQRELDDGVLGYSDFFRYTYEIAGFEDYRPKDGCSHPTVNARVQMLERVKDTIEIERLLGNQIKWKRQMEERIKNEAQPTP